jgi:hypothetical protein
MSDGGAGGWRPHSDGMAAVLKLLTDTVKATSTDAHSQVMVELEKMKQHPEFNVSIILFICCFASSTHSSLYLYHCMCRYRTIWHLCSPISRTNQMQFVLMLVTQPTINID